MAAASRPLSDPRIVRGAQIVIGVIFVVSSLSKIGDIPAFATQVQNFRMAPIWGENLIAMILPWIELVAGLALVLGARARPGAVVVTFLMAVFTVGVVVAMARGLDFECGCFGTADHTRVGAVKLVENLLMLGIAAIATVKPSELRRDA